jgi:epoxyqueuosine reductase QueG
MRHESITRAIQEAAAQFGADLENGTIWKPPLTAFVSATDSGFARLKEAVSPSHLLPEDVLPGAKTVISFFIPFQDRIVKSNENGDAASREWAEAYVRTNELIKRTSETLALLLEHNGFRAGQIPATHNFDEERLISNWSHRHIAHIAGLGSFGVNNMLITDLGCCGRFGSLVTDWEPETGTDCNGTNRPPSRQNAAERCLYKRNGSCGLCRAKCPAGAYPSGIFDRRICYQRCLQNAALYRGLGLADVCGKCLCGLPCSTRTPHPLTKADAIHS